MDFVEAVMTRALAITDLQAIVGDQIFWKRRKQGEPLPALILTRAGGEGEDLDLEDEADSTETRLQFSALPGSFDEASRILDIATAAFIGDFAVEDFLFWLGERDPVIDLGSDSTPDGFIFEAEQDVSIRHSRLT